jgi:hypothetical protein
MSHGHFNSTFFLEYGIRMTEENQKGLELSGRQQLLVCADDVTLLRKKRKYSKEKHKSFMFH